jgi:hypothetical protein
MIEPACRAGTACYRAGPGLAGMNANKPGRARPEYYRAGPTIGLTKTGRAGPGRAGPEKMGPCRPLLLNNIDLPRLVEIVLWDVIMEIQCNHL